MTLSDDQRLAIQSETMFVLDGMGRILHENEPAPTSDGPRFWMAGCETGNRFRLHADVSASCAAKIASLMADEPPLQHAGTRPRNLARYIELLGATKQEQALNYELPNPARF